MIQRARRVTALALLIPLIASCWMHYPAEIFWPCEGSRGFNFGGQRDQGMVLDGSWDLNRVDGQFAPFFLESGKGVLEDGRLEFHTWNIDEGSCDQPKRSSGEVIALYHIEGQPKGQAGRFEYENASKTVTLSALGKTAGGKAELFDPRAAAAPVSVMTIVTTIPEGGSSGRLRTLVFHRFRR